MADVEEAGRRLWTLWRERRRIDRLPPGLHPATEDEGYAVQDALVRAAALPLAGWKIGATSAHARRRLGLPGPVSGRLFAPFVFRAPAALSAADYVGPSLEPEFAFRMARGRGADVMGDPLEAMTWLANHLCARGLQLRSGELVTSGTCTPIVAIAPGQSAVARFEGVGAVELRLSGRQEP